MENTAVISQSQHTAPQPPQQRYLGNKGLIFFLVLLSAFVPLSTDLYLPALPSMTRYFNVPEVMTNLTIILFFVFFSLFTLLWGPLSDKYGRRPILLIALIGYMVASILCALSPTITMLIVSRILQAIGASAATAMATAIVKDTYEGHKLEKTLAIIQTISVICPIAGPMIGAFILRFTDWRGAFFALAIIGVIVTVQAFLYTETLTERSTGTTLKTMGRLIVVLRNKRFSALLVIFASSGITFLAFISASAYIYEDFFHLSSQMYSYLFSFNALMMMVGPFLYVKLSAHFSRFSLVNLSFAVTVVAGVLICTIGQINPWAFALTLLPTTIMGSFVAPPSRFLLLSQQSGDTGSASALINAFSSIAGSIGMIVASLHIGNLVIIIGALNIFMGLACGGAWLFFTNRPLLRDLKN